MFPFASLLLLWLCSTFDLGFSTEDVGAKVRLNFLRRNDVDVKNFHVANQSGLIR